MRSSPTRDFLVGCFVLVGLGALAWLSLSVGGLSLRPSNGLVLYANFTQIAGLKPRAPVVIAGVKVGDVQSIALGKGFAARVVAGDPEILSGVHHGQHAGAVAALRHVEAFSEREHRGQQEPGALRSEQSE